jgi:hypothetical protein
MQITGLKMMTLFCTIHEEDKEDIGKLLLGPGSLLKC